MPNTTFKNHLDRSACKIPGTDFYEYRFLAYGDGMCCSTTESPGFSTPVLTPTAAKGICDGIFLDKVTLSDGSKRMSVAHQTMQIEVVRHPKPPPEYAKLRFPVRNVVHFNGVADKDYAKRCLVKGFYDPQMKRNRFGRTINYVAFPAFLVTARLCLLPAHTHRREKQKTLATYVSQLLRRIKRGYGYRDLYFGQHRFPCRIAQPSKLDRIVFNEDLGHIVYDYDYDDDGRKVQEWTTHAVVENGVLTFSWDKLKSSSRVRETV